MPQNIFDNEAFFEGYRALRATDNNYNVLLEQPAMAALLPDLKEKAVLDLGCGYGHNCMDFVRRGASRVVGADLSEKMLAVAKKQNSHEKIAYYNMDMTELDALGQGFDLVYSSLAFHYVEHFAPFVQKIYNALSPGGMLLFSQEHPIITATQNGAGGWVTNEAGEKVAYTFSNYSQSGRRSGFWFVEDVEEFHRPMSEIITTLARTGFRILDVVEPVPSEAAQKKLPAIKKEFLKPNFLIVRAQKD